MTQKEKDYWQKHADLENAAEVLCDYCREQTSCKDGCSFNLASGCLFQSDPFEWRKIMEDEKWTLKN